MAKLIEIELNRTSIDAAIKALDAFSREVRRKTDELQERVTELVASYAKTGFNGAVVDDLVSGGPKLAEVTVRIENDNGTSLVIADGKDAVFVEFGAGVYHNGPVGSSPHPNGVGLGLTIGSYGPNSARRTWGFYNEDEELVLTRGTPASMPLYTALQIVCADVVQIAKEVFA